MIVDHPDNDNATHACVKHVYIGHIIGRQLTQDWPGLVQDSQAKLYNTQKQKVP